jgi:chromatin segregation and condensation protein Rec8/ScpA/Scc1 (kleisin family)
MQQPELSNIDKNTLPVWDGLNIAALSRLFASTTNSYKYIFFISILDLIHRRKFDVSAPISFRDLVIEMLTNAALADLSCQNVRIKQELLGDNQA